MTTHAAPRPTIRTVQTDALDPHERQALLETLVGIDREASGDAVQRYWASRPNFFGEVAAVLVAETDERPVAFASYQFWPDEDPALYLDLIVVIPEYRTTSIAKRLVSDIVAGLVMSGQTRFFVIGRTENPIALHAFREGFGAENTFPQVEPGHALPTDVVECARRTRARLWPTADLDESSLILRGAYGDTFIEAPTVPTEEIADFFGRNLTTADGDAILIISRLDVSGLTLPTDVHGDDLIEEGNRLRAQSE